MSGWVANLIPFGDALQQADRPLHSAYLLPADREQDASMLPSIPVTEMMAAPVTTDSVEPEQENLGVVQEAAEGQQGPSAAVLLQLREDIAVQLNAAEDIRTDAKRHDEVSRLQDECMQLQCMFQDAMDKHEKARVTIKQLRQEILRLSVEVQVPVPVPPLNEVASYKFRELLMQKLEAEDRAKMNKRSLSTELEASAEHKSAKTAKRASKKTAVKQ